MAKENKPTERNASAIQKLHDLDLLWRMYLAVQERTTVNASMQLCGESPCAKYTNVPEKLLVCDIWFIFIFVLIFKNLV